MAVEKLIRGAECGCQTAWIFFLALHALQPVRNTTSDISVNAHVRIFWDRVLKTPWHMSQLPPSHQTFRYNSDMLLLLMQNGIFD